MDDPEKETPTEEPTPEAPESDDNGDGIEEAEPAGV